MSGEKIQIFEGVDDDCIYIFMNYKGKGKVYKFKDSEEALTTLKTHVKNKRSKL